MATQTAERRVSRAMGAEAFTIVVDKRNVERVCARRAAAAGLIKTCPHAATRNQTQLDWITSRSITNRRLPTLDVFSEIYQAHVDRIEYEFGEVAVAKKLGNNSDSCYTKRLSVDVPERAYSTVCWNPDRKYELSFAYHRSGIRALRFEPHFFYLPDQDPALLNGQPLLNAGIDAPLQ